MELIDNMIAIKFTRFINLSLKVMGPSLISVNTFSEPQRLAMANGACNAMTSPTVFKIKEMISVVDIVSN